VSFDDLKTRLNAKGIYPKGTSQRFKDLDALERVLQGTIFKDTLMYSFDQEEDVTKKYIPLRDRRPAMIYNLAKIIVDHTKALTFGEAHAPSVRVVVPKDVETEITAKHKLMEHIIEEIDLDATCMELMEVGSVGSVAVVMYAQDDGLPWFDILDSKYCTPFFDLRNPHRLDHMERVYDCSVFDLEQAGYDPADYDVDKEPYWIRILYTAAGEKRSYPMPQQRYERLGEDDPDNIGSKIRWIEDVDRSYTNEFSFMNVLWIRNLEERRKIDGKSTFETIIDFMIEISYLMSQIGRGFKYTGDPLLAIQRGEMNALNPIGGFSGGSGSAASSASVARQPNRALMLPAGSEAKLLEITGQGLHQGAEFIRLIREYALEVISGMKADQQNASGVHSGRALEYLHKALIWLVERFRIAYGTRGYLEILRMVLRGLKEGTLQINDVDPNEIDVTQPMRLVWPQWETPTGQDLLSAMQAYEMAAGGSVQLPVPIVAREYVAQKAAAAMGISDANRAAAQLLKDSPDTPTPIELEQQKNDISKQDSDTKRLVANKPTPAPTIHK